MANVKLSYASPVTLSIGSANLATSPTAGWQSDGQDNTSNLYIDAQVQVSLAAVNTAPANNQAIYLFAFGSVDGTNYGSTGAATVSGTQGTLTFPNITSSGQVAPMIGFIPYTTQNQAFLSAPFSIAAGFGGKLPQKYSIGMVNYSGMTLNVTFIKITPIFYTVA